MFTGFVMQLVDEYSSEFEYYDFTYSELDLLITQAKYNCPDLKINDKNRATIWKYIDTMRYHNWWNWDFPYELKERAEQYL